MSLKNIIENFLAHVEEYENKLNDNEDVYEKEFQNLKVLTDEIRATTQYSCSAGEIPENRRKNRYKDILPYDSNRVTLHDDAEVPGSDYINASFVKGASGSIAYIAAQAPLPNTVDDFWRMIWDSEVLTIVMVCNEIEAGRPKCERYWTNKNEVKKFGRIMVKLVEEREIGVDYKIRQLSISFGDLTRTIHHFHYHTWPDHGTPLSVRAIIDMVGLIRKFQANETVPVLVHCSAGCGRTGTVCAIDYVGGLLRLGKLTEDFSIKQLVFEMRKQRIAMVQTVEQYIVVHRAVRELFEDHLKVIDSHPYANIDFSGNPYLAKVNNDYETVNHRVDSAGPVMITVSKEESISTADNKVPPLPKKTKSEQQRKSEWDSLSKVETDYLETNASEKSTNKSRMDYVKDWCDGILTKAVPNEGVTQSDQTDDILSQQPFATKRSTPSQSPYQSPSLKRCSTSEMLNDKQSVVGKPNLSNLVHRPSIAKFKAFFDGASNSGSSGTSSPENWLSRGSSRTKKLDKPQEEKAATAGDSLSVQKPTRSKSRAKDVEFLKDKMSTSIMNRYDDTSYRIFKEQRNLSGDCYVSQDFQYIASTPTPSSRSGNGDDFSLSDSPSPRINRRRNYLSVSHSPLPTSSSESVVKDLVTRVVGSRRNSFAEKRSSTWYDGAETSNNNEDNVKKSSYRKSAHQTGSNGKSKHSGGNSNSAAVKRSISMKVGFRSPLFTRKKNNNVAAYLAVEESKKKEISNTQERNAGNGENDTVNDLKLTENNGGNVKSEIDKLVNESPSNLNNSKKNYAYCRTTPVPSPRLSRFQVKEKSPSYSKIENKNVGSSLIRDSRFSSLNKNIDNNDGKQFKNENNDAVVISRLSLSQNTEDKPDINRKLSKRSEAEETYGAEMDEYCQKIILDCQEYLVSRHSPFISAKVKESDEQSKSETTTKIIANCKSDHDYERLWLSRSVPKNAVKSEENVGLIQDGKSTFYVDDKVENIYANHDFHQHNLNIKARGNNNKENRNVDVSSDDERRVINQDSNQVIAEVGHRKPLPAPRTIIHASKMTDEGLSVHKQREDESSSQNCFNYPITSDQLNVVKRNSCHDYENSVLRSGSYRLAECRAVCDEPGDAQHFVSEGSNHPLYRSIHKCKSRASAEEDGLQQCIGDKTDDGVLLRTKNADGHTARYMSKSVMLVKPVAPPRLRRKPSLSSPRSLQTSNETSTSLDFHRHSYYDSCNQQELIISKIYDDADSSEEIPPVPIKTKDAYRLPQDELSVSDLTSIESHSAFPGLQISKALNKIQSNFLSKLAHGNDDKETEKVSKSSGAVSRNLSQKCLVPGFPERLNEKPSGPREQPHHWKISSCTL